MGKVSYENKKVFIGIDVHKKDYAVVAIMEGEKVFKGRCPAEPGKMADFLKKRFLGAELRTVYEAGSCGFVLHRALERAGIDNIVVNAASVEVNSRDRVKTDKRDANKLAEHLSQGRLKAIRVPSEQEELNRVLSRTREQLVKNRARVMIQVRMKLLQFGLLPKDYSKELTIKDVKEWLVNEVRSELLTGVKILLTTWAYFSRQIKQLERKLKTQAANDPNEAIYRTVPGIGIIGARVLSNELGDMSRFKSEKKLCNFVGLTPTEYSSGETIHRGHISRQGSGRLRQILTQAAWTVIREDAAFKAIYDRISHRAGGKRAIVAVARKLLCRIRHIFRTGEVYCLGYGVKQEVALAA